MKDNLLVQNLFDAALVSPLLRNSRIDTLRIVSGYATAAMGFHHLDMLRSMEKRLCVELIYGMCRSEGLSKSNHEKDSCRLRRSLFRANSLANIFAGARQSMRRYMFSARGVILFAPSRDRRIIHKPLSLTVSDGRCLQSVRPRVHMTSSSRSKTTRYRVLTKRFQRRLQ